MSDCRQCEEYEDEILRLRAQIQRLTSPPVVVDEILRRRIDAAREAAVAHGFLREVVLKAEGRIGPGPGLLAFLERLASGPFVSERYRRLHPEVDDVAELLRP